MEGGINRQVEGDRTEEIGELLGNGGPAVSARRSHRDPNSAVRPVVQALEMHQDAGPELHGPLAAEELEESPGDRRSLGVRYGRGAGVEQRGVGGGG